MILSYTSGANLSTFNKILSPSSFLYSHAPGLYTQTKFVIHTRQSNGKKWNSSSNLIFSHKVGRQLSDLFFHIVKGEYKRILFIIMGSRRGWKFFVADFFANPTCFAGTSVSSVVQAYLADFFAKPLTGSVVLAVSSGFSGICISSPLSRGDRRHVSVCTRFSILYAISLASSRYPFRFQYLHIFFRSKIRSFKELYCPSLSEIQSKF